LRLEIWERDSNDDLVSIDLPDDPGSIDELYFIPIENQVVFNFRIRPDECAIGDTPDCHYYVEIKTAETPENSLNTDNYIVSTEGRFNGDWEMDNSFTDLGEILGNCGNNCAQSPWQLTQYPQGTLPLLKEINEDNQEPIGVNIVQNFDENNPCYENGSYREDCYELLAPLPESEDSFFQTDENTGRQFVITTDLEVGDYVNQFFKIALGILMVMAVIMIVIAGVEYMTVESIYGKSNARNRILGAVTGLILSLGIFLILNTINPRLLEVNFQAPEVNINIQQLASIGAADIDPTVTATLDANNISYLEDSNIFCPREGGASNIKQIAESFEGKTTYRLGGKIVNIGSQNPGYAGSDATNTCPVETNTLCLDCSGFVSAVLYCAGITENGTINGGYGTSSIFSHSSALLIDSISNNNEVIINNQTRELQVGDLLGYSSNPYGHVGIYIGDGKVAEATSNANGRSTNAMIIIRNTTERQSYKKTLVPVAELIAE
jgi:cell wall-associated NlpC family hydrolase